MLFSRHQGQHTVLGFPSLRDHSSSRVAVALHTRALSLSSASLGGRAWCHVFKAISRSAAARQALQIRQGHGTALRLPTFPSQEAVSLSRPPSCSAQTKEGVVLQPLASPSSAPASPASGGHLFWSMPSRLLTGLPAASLTPTIHPPSGLPTGASPEKCSSEHATPPPRMLSHAI